MSTVADGVGNVVDTIGDGLLVGLRFGRDAVTQLTDLSLTGAKKGLKLFKIPLDKLKASGANLNVVRKMDLRKLFQAKYGADIKRTAEDDDIDEPTEEEEQALTDDKIQEFVERKYFDREYDPVFFELSQLQPTWTDNQVDLEAEKKAIEDAILDRRQKCKLVGTTLKQRVLHNHDGFISGGQQINTVNEDIKQTSAICADARRRISLQKKSYVGGALLIPVLNRRRHHLRAVAQLTTVMHNIASKYEKLTQLLDMESFVEAVALVQDHSTIAELETLKPLKTMRDLMDKWELYTLGSGMLLSRINASLTSMLSNLRNFQEIKYRSAMEASRRLEELQDCCNNVIQSLWNNAILTLIRALTDVSQCQDEKVSLAVIAAKIPQENLSVALVQLCGKVMDALLLYNCVCKAHLEEIQPLSDASKQPPQSPESNVEATMAEERRAFHKQALECIKPVGRRIGRDVGDKIALVLQNCMFQHVELDVVLHVYFNVSMLVEGMVVLGLAGKELASVRSTVKESLVTYMQHHYFLKRSNDMLGFMTEESWDALPSFTAGQLRIVKPLTPDTYRQAIRIVKKYASCDAPNSISRMQENPFFSKSFINTSTVSDRETLEELAQRDTECGIVIPRSTCVVQSSAFVVNMMNESIARIVVRFPPLAAEVIQWCVDIAALYILTIADNFVSVSRDIPLEEQPHFTAEGRATVSGILRPSVARCRPGEPGMSILGNLPEALMSREKLLGLVERCVAVESAQSLLLGLRGSLSSVSQLLPAGTVDAHKNAIALMSRFSEECLQVIMHRMVLANFDIDPFAADLSNLLNGSMRADMQPSVCIQNLIRAVSAFMNRVNFSSKKLEDTFICRLVFAVQTLIVQQYGLLVMNPKIQYALMNVNKPKIPDLFLVQLNVDTTAFNERVVDMMPIGAKSLALPNYVKDFVKAGLEMNYDNRIKWIRANHIVYHSADVSNWLCFSSRRKKEELDNLLASIGHHDTIPQFALKF